MNAAISPIQEPPDRTDSAALLNGHEAKQGSDEAIMAAVMVGDLASLPRLVERYQATLLSMFRRMLGGDPVIAEDLVQETFLRLLQQRSFSPDRPFKPWLYTVASNLARDHRRAEARRRLATGEDELHSIPDRRPGPDEHVETTSELSRIIAALARLPEQYRLTLTLRYFDDMTVSEIADVLRIPLGTVKSRLTVGKQRLYTLLADSRGGSGM
jgi:RNA polymerase sigma-70 factor, ECF subfamily